MLTLRDRLGAVPLLILPVAAYGLFALAAGAPEAARRLLAEPLLRLPTARGGPWPVSLSDLMLAAALIVFFLELFKSMATRRLALVNHVLAMALFVACLCALLLAPAFATSTFFLIALMVLLDVVAGFVATVAREEG